MNPIPALLIVATLAVSGCISSQTDRAESHVSAALIAPARGAGVALPGAQDPGMDGPLQTYKASWTTGLRGPACYVGAVNVCCNGDLREFMETAGDGVLFDRFAIDQATWGRPARATFWAAVPTTEGAGLAFLNERGTVVGGRNTWMDGPLAHNGLARTVVPPGAMEGVFWSCVSGPMSAWYEAGPMYETDSFTMNSTAGAGLNVLCPPRVGVQTSDRGGRFATDATWPIGEQLADGRPARVTNVHVRFISLTMSDALITIFDADGKQVVSGTAPLVTQRITKPGEYTVRVQPCGATGGPYTVQGLADLVAATSAKVSGSAPSMEPSTTQAYEAHWKVGLGARCYSSVVVVPCCTGKFADTLTALGDGITFDRFPIDAGTWGAPFVMKSELAIEGFHITFLDHQGRILLTRAGAGVAGEAKGVVPQGAIAGVATSCISGPMSASYRAGVNSADGQ